MSFIGKGLVDIKQETINRYERQCKDLKEEISSEREKVKELLRTISASLKDIETSNLDPVNSALLGNIIRQAEEPIRALEQEFIDCEVAADWVDTCKKTWAKKASNFSARRYPRLVPFYRKLGFIADL